MPLNRAVRAVLADPPLTFRKLAARAGVTHGLLSQILSGRQNATPAVALALAEALEGHSQETTAAAKRIRTALARRRSS